MAGCPAVSRRICRPACRPVWDGDLRQLRAQGAGAGGGDGR
jgi:hypothetical protein